MPGNRLFIFDWLSSHMKNPLIEILQSDNNSHITINQLTLEINTTFLTTKQIT
jgi:hypothetical protein